MKRLRLIMVLLCLTAAGFAGAMAWRVGVFKPKAATTAEVGGPFVLIDQDAKPATEAVLKGRWSAVFFGYTYCPDICPGTLQALGQASKALGDKAKDLQVVFVSIDPARDTPQQMKDYLAATNLPVRTVGLTGTPDQVAKAAQAYRVFYQKDGEGEGYLMSHSTAVYLTDPQGRFSRVLAYGMTPDQMAEQIKLAMAGG